MYHVSIVLNRNMSGSLAEQEMVWEHEPTGECFYSFFKFFPNFCKCFHNSIETWRTCFPVMLEIFMTKKEINF